MSTWGTTFGPHVLNPPDLKPTKVAVATAVMAQEEKTPCRGRVAALKWKAEREESKGSLSKPHHEPDGGGGQGDPPSGFCMRDVREQEGTGQGGHHNHT